MNEGAYIPAVNTPRNYDEYESTLSYVFINVFVAVSIVMITIFEAQNSCSTDIHYWLLSYIILLFLDSALKLINLKRRNFSQQVRVITTVIEFLSDLLQVLWLLYGNMLFMKESKECLSNSPLLTYTLLFVLILGFIHLAKFTFILLGIIIWIIAKCFGVEFSFEEILNTNRESFVQQNQPWLGQQLQQPLFEKGQGLPMEKIEALKEMSFAKYAHEIEEQYKSRQAANIISSGGGMNNHIDSFLCGSPLEFDDICAICCGMFYDDEDIKILPCHEQHIFHKYCITEWL